MMLTVASLFLIATDPLFTGRAYEEVVTPYVSCLNERHNAIVSQINGGDSWASSESESAEMEAQIRADILTSCVTERKRAASRAIKRLRTAKPTDKQLAKIETLLKEVDETFVPPVVVPVAVPVPQATNAAN